MRPRLPRSAWRSSRPEADRPGQGPGVLQEGAGGLPEAGPDHDRAGPEPRRARPCRRSIWRSPRTSRRGGASWPRRRTRSSSPSWSELRNVVNGIAQKESFTMVFDAAGIAYAPESLDITAQVIRTYNEQNKPKVATPAPRSPTPRRSRGEERGADGTLPGRSRRARRRDGGGDARQLIAGVSGLEEAGPRRALLLRQPALPRLAADHPCRGGADRPRGAGLSHRRRLGAGALAAPGLRPHPGPLSPRPGAWSGVSPRRQVHPSARVDPSATVMAFAVVEAGAGWVRAPCSGPGCYVGLEAQVGSDCVVHPSVVIRERCRVGDRVVLQPGRWWVPTASASPSTPAVRPT